MTADENIVAVHANIRQALALASKAGSEVCTALNRADETVPRKITSRMARNLDMLNNITSALSRVVVDLEKLP